MTEDKTVDAVQRLLSEGRVASLGTLTTENVPFVTLVTFARTGKATLAMLLSGLAKHTKNLESDARCSLLIAGSGDTADPMAAARVTLVGEVTKLDRADDDAVRETFLAKQPSAAMYADFGDFAFFEFTITQAHLVAGFGRIQTLDGSQLI